MIAATGRKAVLLLAQLILMVLVVAALLLSAACRSSSNSSSSIRIDFCGGQTESMHTLVCAHKRHDVGCSVLYFFWGVTLELMYVVLIQQTKPLKAKEEWKGAVGAS